MSLLHDQRRRGVMAEGSSGRGHCNRVGPRLRWRLDGDGRRARFRHICLRDRGDGHIGRRRNCPRRRVIAVRVDRSRRRAPTSHAVYLPRDGSVGGPSQGGRELLLLRREPVDSSGAHADGDAVPAAAPSATATATAGSKQKRGNQDHRDQCAATLASRPLRKSSEHDTDNGCPQQQWSSAVFLSYGADRRLVGTECGDVKGCSLRAAGARIDLRV